LTEDESACLNLYSKKSTSKKDVSVRQAELVKCVQKPLEMFFEEKLQFYIMDINHSFVLQNLCSAIVKNGSFGESDLMDEMLRVVQKPLLSDEATPDQKYMIFGGDIHRFLKDMVKSECEAVKEGVELAKPLPYSKSVAMMLLKNFDETIKTRAVFVLLALVENPETAGLVKEKLNK